MPKRKCNPPITQADCHQVAATQLDNGQLTAHCPFGPDTGNCSVYVGSAVCTMCYWFEDMIRISPKHTVVSCSCGRKRINQQPGVEKCTKT